MHALSLNEGVVNHTPTIIEAKNNQSPCRGKTNPIQEGVRRE